VGRFRHWTAHAPFWCALVGCIEFSPFETDLDASERHQTRKQLERIAELEAPKGPFRFAVVSDNHAEYDALGEVVDVLNARDDLAFVVHLGDMTDLGLREQYRQTLDELLQLDIPFATAIGNHDALSSGVDIYRAMFGPLDYTFTYGGVRFVVVNANTLEFPDRQVPNPAWLEDAVAPSSDLSGVITFSHHRLKREGITSILVEAGVLAAFRGHAHRFEREVVDGVPMLTTGTTINHEWLLVTVDGPHVQAAECTRSICLEQRPSW
jgi:Icc protein